MGKKSVLPSDFALALLRRIVYTPTRARIASFWDGIIVSELAVSRIICGLVLLGAAVLSGCDESAAPAETSSSLVEIGRAFDPAIAGEIRGRVTWRGALPEVPPYRAPVSPGNEHAGQPFHHWPNPYAPCIDPGTSGVAGCVISLRGVDPQRSRPWDLPPVRIELRDYQIHVCQGDRDASCGFVRRGDAITMISRQGLFHSLHVRGAAFFARGFPDADQPCSQRLEQNGIVELNSGCGYFWMRGQLFVDEHPYYTLTEADGSFTLPQVPPGRYQLVCWLPDWHEASRELDAETALICRLTFRPPLEIVRPVELAPRQTRAVAFELDAGRFGR